MAEQARLFPAGRYLRRTPGRARAGLAVTLTALEELGRVDQLDTAVVALNCILADQLDDVTSAKAEESAYTVGVIAGRYQNALELLLSRDLEPLTDDDDFAEALAAIEAGMHADPRDLEDPGTPD